jgi:hypothetical protein
MIWDEINIPSHDLIRWMNVVRSFQGRDQSRVLESFWASQIRSKAWVVNALKYMGPGHRDNIYVFGGWYGVGANLLKRAFPRSRVVSIDIDPMCREIGMEMNPDVEFVTCDMADFWDYGSEFIAVNCSTEHVTQETFDEWRNTIPKSQYGHDCRRMVVMQGNNFDIPEHVRIANSHSHFMEINRVGDRLVFDGSLNCVQFTRYMTMEYV